MIRSNRIANIKLRLRQYLNKLRYSRYLAITPEIKECSDHLTNRIYNEASTKFKLVISKNQLKIAVETAIVRGGGASEIFADIANLLVNAGEAESALLYYTKSLDLKPNRNIHSLYLQTLALSHRATDERIMQECLKSVDTYYNINKLHEMPTTFRHKNANRKLKIGYICHFFHNSVSQSIILPFISSHDHNRVEVYCYSDWESSEVKPEVRASADHWRDTKNLDDNAFYDLVINDDIDIIIEMNGHTIINRYHACMRRLAPVQINFYNFAATCGIPCIDYIMIDDKIIEPSEEKYFTEKVYRLPNAYGVANFSNAFPEVAPCPFKKNGYITFGSFGGSHKINEYTIKIWSKVLHRVPNARFFMKAGAFTFDMHKDNFYRYFEKKGISKDRLLFEGWSEHQEMLNRYAEVDIALDSFPYNAGTTTLEALWQGIPVVSLCGNRLAARTGKSILTNLGHPEFVAYDEDEFVNIAVNLANNLSNLEHLRESLRDQFRSSVLYDAKLFATDLEDAYYAMWNKWSASEASSSEDFVAAQI